MDRRKMPLLSATQGMPCVLRPAGDGAEEGSVWAEKAAVAGRTLDGLRRPSYGPDRRVGLASWTGELNWEGSQDRVSVKNSGWF